MGSDTMTTRERMRRMFDHQEADRVPVVGHPWPTTIERWLTEGLPADEDYVNYLGLDRVRQISADNSPRFPEETLEETEAYRIHTSRWGPQKRTGSILPAPLSIWTFMSRPRLVGGGQGSHAP